MRYDTANVKRKSTLLIKRLINSNIKINKKNQIKYCIEPCDNNMKGNKSLDDPKSVISLFSVFFSPELFRRAKIR